MGGANPAEEVGIFAQREHDYAAGRSKGRTRIHTLQMLRGFLDVNLWGLLTFDPARKPYFEQTTKSDPRRALKHDSQESCPDIR